MALLEVHFGHAALCATKHASRQRRRVALNLLLQSTIEALNLLPGRFTRVRIDSRYWSIASRGSCPRRLQETGSISKSRPGCTSEVRGPSPPAASLAAAPRRAPGALAPPKPALLVPLFPFSPTCVNRPLRLLPEAPGVHEPAPPPPAPLASPPPLPVPPLAAAYQNCGPWRVITRDAFVLSIVFHEALKIQ